VQQLWFHCAKKTSQLWSIDPRRVYRAADLCDARWGVQTPFRESLKKLFQTEVPRGEVFIDPTGELWCKLDNITAHLKHGGRGR
jgi:hypothetical protein